MVNPLESISRFVNNVGDTIGTTFKNISDFIDTVITFFVSMGFWVSVIVFFIIFVLIIMLPLIFVKYWDDVTDRYKKVTNKLFSSMNSR